MSVETNTAFKQAQKIALQKRARAREQRALIISSISKNAEFLDFEMSLAIWGELHGRRLWDSNAGRSEYCSYRFTGNVEKDLAKFSQALSELDNANGFCFPLEWDLTGAFILDLKALMKEINNTLFILNDELKFYTSDFSSAILISGERSGTADSLNELNFSVIGRNWRTAIKNRFLQN